jgi:hypothetical protein
MLQKIELFLISLAPLFGLLFVSTVKVPRCWGEGCSFIGWGELLRINIVPAVFLVILLCVVLMYLRFNYEAKGATQLAKRIKEIENIQFENLSFLATYIIPLVAFDLSKTRGCIMLVLVLSLMGAIFVNTNTFYLNPALAVLGYRIYRITSSKDEKLIVITRSKLAVNDWIRPRLIDEKIYFAAKTYEQGTDS